MGEPYKDSFTPEELAALGEAVPEKTEETEESTGKTQETEEKKTEETQETKTEEPETEQKTETETQTPEEKQAAEAMGFRLETDDKGKVYVVDDEGTKIPAQRWTKLYRGYQEKTREAQTKQEKFDLFRTLGADEYYRIFPDEKPAGYKPPAETPKAASGKVDPLDLIVNDPANPDYHGRPLREIKDVDPFYAAVLFTNWQNQQAAVTEKSKRDEEETRKTAEQEATSFGMARVKELWGIDDPSKVTPEQEKAILDLGQKVIAWQTKNSCLHYTWEHAYKLMMHDELIAKARDEGAKGTLKSLQGGRGPASIDTGKGGLVKDHTFDAMEKWSDSQLEDHLDKLSEAETVKFLKDAPPKIKARLGM